MGKLVQWFESQGGWACSEFSGLPRLDPEDDDDVQRWRVVAGGLALILSRLRPVELQQRFAATHALYRQVRRALRHDSAPRAAAALINDVMHEIANVADPQTKTCLRACFHATLGRPAHPMSVPPALAGDSLQTAPRSLAAA